MHLNFILYRNNYLIYFIKYLSICFNKNVKKHYSKLNICEYKQKKTTKFLCKTNVSETFKIYINKIKFK